MNLGKLEILVGIGVAGALYYAYTSLQKKRIKQPFTESMICNDDEDCDVFRRCIPSTNVPGKNVCSAPSKSAKRCNPSDPTGDEACSSSEICMSDGSCVPKPAMFGCEVFGCTDPGKVCIGGKCVQGTCAQLKAAGKEVKCGAGLRCIDIQAGQDYFPSANNTSSKAIAKSGGPTCAYIAPSNCPSGQAYKIKGSSPYTKVCQTVTPKADKLKYGQWYLSSVDPVNDSSVKPTQTTPSYNQHFYADVNIYGAVFNNNVGVMGVEFNSMTKNVLFAVYPVTAASTGTNTGIGTQVKYGDEVVLAIASRKDTNGLLGNVVNITDLKAKYAPTQFVWSWIGPRQRYVGDRIWLASPYSRAPHPPSPAIFIMKQTDTTQGSGSIDVGGQIAFQLSATIAGTEYKQPTYLSYTASDSGSAATFGSGWTYLSVNGPMSSTSSYRNIHRFWNF